MRRPKSCAIRRFPKQNCASAGPYGLFFILPRSPASAFFDSQSHVTTGRVVTVVGAPWSTFVNVHRCECPPLNCALMAMHENVPALANRTSFAQRKGVSAMPSIPAGPPGGNANRLRAVVNGGAVRLRVGGCHATSAGCVAAGEDARRLRSRPWHGVFQELFSVGCHNKLSGIEVVNSVIDETVTLSFSRQASCIKALGGGLRDSGG